MRVKREREGESGSEGEREREREKTREKDSERDRKDFKTDQPKPLSILYFVEAAHERDSHSLTFSFSHFLSSLMEVSVIPLKFHSETPLQFLQNFRKEKA